MFNDIPTKQMADFLGTTMGFVTHIRKGRRKLPPKDCYRVHERFGIPLHELRPDIFPPIQPPTVEAITQLNQ